MIQDVDGVKQWFEDDNSIGDKFVDSGQTVQTGRLNFSNGLYESRWKFRPNPPLYKGYTKAVVFMFEGPNVYPLTFQEKNIHLY